MTSPSTSSTGATSEEHLAEAGSHFRALRGLTDDTIPPVQPSSLGQQRTTSHPGSATSSAGQGNQQWHGLSDSSQRARYMYVSKNVGRLPQRNGIAGGSSGGDGAKNSAPHSNSSYNNREGTSGRDDADSTNSASSPAGVSSREWRRQLTVPRLGALRFFIVALSTPTVNWALPFLIVLAAAIVAVAQRQLYASVGMTTPFGQNSTGKEVLNARHINPIEPLGLAPSFVLAVALGFTGVAASALLLLAHTVYGVGFTAERTLFSFPALVRIAVLSFVGLLVSAYCLPHMTWSQAVLFNPFSIAPFAVLLSSSFLLSPAKSLSAKAGAVVIVVAAILFLVEADSFFGTPILAVPTESIAQSGLQEWRSPSVQVALMSDNGASGSDNSSSGPSGNSNSHHTVESASSSTGGGGASKAKEHWGEAVYCLLSTFGGVCVGLAISLWERYFLLYPIQPLYAVSIVAALQFALIPIAVLVDVMPLLGQTTNVSAAIARVFEGGVSAGEAAAGGSGAAAGGLSISVILFAVCLAGFFTVVVPLISRCTSLLVPVFALGPILASIPTTNPLALIIGGVYAAMQMLLILSSEPAYDEETVMALQRGARLRSVPQPTITWRHGCSVLFWRRLGVDEPSFSPCLGFVRLLGILGWVPISVVVRDNIKYSRVPIPWRTGLTPVRGLNLDTEGETIDDNIY